MKGADDLIKAAIIAGSPVTSKGRAKAIMTGAVVGQVAGSIGKVGAEMGAERKGEGASPMPAKAFALAYLAVTADELVLLEAKNGLIGPKAVGVLATAPRSDVAGVEFGEGKLQAPLKLSFH